MPTKHTVYWSIHLLLLLAVATGFFLTYLLWCYDYETLTTYILQRTGKEDWRTRFETQIFTPQKFQLARYAILGCLVLAAGTILYWTRQKTRIKHWQDTLYTHWKQHAWRWKGETRAEKYSLAIIVLLFTCRTLYYVDYLAIQYDEAWTYQHFVSKGALFSALSPHNNHNLYTILASWTTFLPIDTKWSLRLPAILSAYLAIFSFYIWCRTFWGTRAALISSAFFTFSSAIFFYSIYARGYGWLYVFTIWSFGILWKWIQDSSQSRPLKTELWALWLITSSLAFYSSIGYLYTHVGLSIFFASWCLSHSKWYLLKKYIFHNLQLIFMVSILYSPLLLTNGAKVLIEASSNSFTFAEAWTRVGQYGGRIVDWWLTGLGQVGVDAFDYYQWGLFTLLLAVLWAWKKEQKVRQTLVFLLFQYLMPILLLLVLRTELPWRLWGFVLIYWAWAVAAIVYHYIKDWKIGYVCLLAVGVGLWQWKWSTTHYFTHWSRDLDRGIEACATFMLDQKIDTCYSFARYDKPLLEYYYLIQDRQIQIYLPFEDSQDYIDLKNQTIPYIIWDKEDYTYAGWEMDYVTEYYTTIYEDKRIILYQKNSSNVRY